MSPLHPFRFQIQQELRNVRIRTGDIFFRLGRESYYCIPFSKMVASLTKSQYSHASIALVEGDQIRLIEVALNGTMELRVIDWVDYSAIETFEVWRLKDEYFKPDTEERLKAAVQKFLDRDAEYDMSFQSDSNRYYCTESVEEVYRLAGLPKLEKTIFINDLMSPWFFKWVFRPINGLMDWLVKASIPEFSPIMVVGNAEYGLMASHYIEPIYKFRIPQGSAGKVWW